jgi:hypothetical protein
MSADLADPAKVAQKNNETAVSTGNPLRLAAGQYVGIAMATLRGGGNGLCGFRLTVGSTVGASHMDADIGGGHTDFLRDEFVFTVA